MVRDVRYLPARMLAIVLLACVAPCLAGLRMQILHNADLHAHFDQIDAYGAACSEEMAQQDRCYGGFARMKYALERAAKEANETGIPVLKLNGGDTFQGTPFYTVFKWRMAAEMIDTLNMDVMALGNHEFDDGASNVASFLKHIKTPVVVCNWNITEEKLLQNLPNVSPSIVVNVNQTPIGIIGYVTPTTSKMSITENIHFKNEIPSIREEAKKLKSEGVKIIIALGHSGIEMDKKIAEEVEEVSLVVGAHTHVLMYTPKENPPSTEIPIDNYPSWVTKPSGKRVPVVHAYAFTKYLGKLLVEFDDEGYVTTAVGNPQILNASVALDSEVAESVKKWSKLIKERMSTYVGHTSVFLKKDDMNSGMFESNLGNLITDAYLDIAVKMAQKDNYKYWTYAPAGIIQNGGIRVQLSNERNNGELTVEDVLTIMPFDNSLVMAKLPGWVLKDVFENSAASFTNYIVEHNQLLQHSGMRVVYDVSREEGNRVEHLEILCANCTVPVYEPLNEQQTYMLVMSSYLLRGGDEYTMIKNNHIEYKNMNITDAESVTQYIQKNRIVYPAIEGRLVVKNATRSGASRSTYPLVIMIFPFFFIVIYVIIF